MVSYEIFLYFLHKTLFFFFNFLHFSDLTKIYVCTWQTSFCIGRKEEKQYSHINSMNYLHYTIIRNKSTYLWIQYTVCVNEDYFMLVEEYDSNKWKTHNFTNFHAIILHFNWKNDSGISVFFAAGKLVTKKKLQKNCLRMLPILTLLLLDSCQYEKV